MAFTKAQLDAYIQGLYDDDGQLSSADNQLIINYILSNGNPEIDPRDLIQWRRGDEADLPTLAQGEAAFTLDTERGFIGGLGGNVAFAMKKDLPYVNVAGYTTEQIQAIITNASASYAVYFGNTPTNIYTILDTLLIPSNTKIVIEENVKLLLGPGINKPLFKNADAIGGNTNITILGGLIDINIANQTVQTPCIRFDNLDNSYFERVVVLGTKFISYVGEGAWHMQDCDNNILMNCELYNSGDEGLMIIGVDNKVIGGVYSENPNGSGIQGAGNNLFIDGTTCKNNNGSSISVHGKNVKVTNNTIIGGGIAGTNGINMGHSGDPVFDGVVSGNTIDSWDGENGIRCNSGSNNVIISDNVVTNLTRVGSTGIGSGDGSKEITVKGNRVKNCKIGIGVSGVGNIVEGNLVELGGSHGIVAYSGVGCIIANNVVKNNGYWGILLDETCFRNIVNGNMVFDDQTVPTQQRGIYISNVDGNNMIVNNFAYGNIEAQITNPNGSELIGNRFSETDFTSVTVTLPDTTSGFVTVTNENIVTGSIISIVPTSVDAPSRQPYLNSQTVGSAQIKCAVAGGVSDTIKLIIR